MTHRPPHLLSENILGGSGGQTAPRRDSDADWIAANLGENGLRLWLMQGATPVEQRSAAMAGDPVTSAIAALAGGWPELPVILRDPSGAVQSGADIPWLPVPCAATPRLVRLGDAPIWLVCGQRQDAPADLLPGAGVEIAGLLAAQPQFDGVVWLAGAHSFWVRVSAGEICHFNSFMTGEMRRLLSQDSALKWAVGGVADDEAFDRALSDAISRPQQIAARLMGLRAAHLLDALSRDSAGAMLAGWLIGWELAAAKPYWLGQQVVLIAGPDDARLYARALQAQGAEAIPADPEAILLAGLHVARNTLA